MLVDSGVEAQSASGRRPELLAPAGDLDCVRAAIENGADAVYFGLGAQFNARARATGLSADDLPEVLSLLHHRGLKGYVTLNTLVYPAELEAMEATIRRVAQAGVDAVIVQDLGVARLARAVCPELPLHASTQMSLSSAEGIRVAQRLGISRVILARELSLADLRAIRAETDAELEVFVHGALCVAYSGQCLASESIGGRSANRGQCAQACRMTYELVCDGQTKDLGPRKYLLSPHDLAAYDLLPELIAAGINAFKIEGRLKSADYVASVTRQYRAAIDAALAGHPIKLTPEQMHEMEVSFSRGLSQGWLPGIGQRDLVSGASSDKRGVHLGEVQRVFRGRVTVALRGPVKRGDGLLFEALAQETTEQGGRVYEVFRNGQPVKDAPGGEQVELAFAHGLLDLAAIRPGQQVWKTDDPALARTLRKSYTAVTPRRRLAIDVVARAAVGQPLRIEARTGNGHVCRLETPDPMPEAQRHPLTAEVLTEQLGRLGGTVYELRKLTANVDGRPMVPLSVLGKLRHEMVQRLDAALAQADPRSIAAPGVAQGLLQNLAAAGDGKSTAEQTRSGTPAKQDTGIAATRLHVLCRQFAQVAPALDCGVDTLLAEFRELGPYRDAVRAAHAARAEIFLAAPRMHKPGETSLLQALLRYEPDGILARNLAGLAFCAGAQIPAVADFALNAANPLTVALLHAQGASRVTVSYDLNRQQALDLAAAVPPEWLEVVVHQHMPMFHTEYCLFCAHLSAGTNRTDCGRPCECHAVNVRDRMGFEHRVETDVACRNTVYHATPQSAAETIPDLLDAGVRHFRVELPTDCNSDCLIRLIAVYRDLLAGRLNGREAWSRLRALSPHGLTRGTWDWE